MPEGVEVNVDYRTILPDGTTLSAEDSRIPITNYEHEQLENEKKRQILIPTPTMLDKIIEEFETLVRYLPHPELDKKGNKKTPLNIAAKFLDNIASAQGSISVIEFSAAGTGATSFDYGPSSSGGATAGVVTGSGGTAVASTTTTPVGFLQLLHLQVLHQILPRLLQVPHQVPHLHLHLRQVPHLLQVLHHLLLLVLVLLRVHHQEVMVEGIDPDDIIDMSIIKTDLHLCTGPSVFIDKCK